MNMPEYSKSRARAQNFSGKGRCRCNSKHWERRFFAKRDFDLHHEEHSNLKRLGLLQMLCRVLSTHRTTRRISGKAALELFCASCVLHLKARWT